MNFQYCVCLTWINCVSFSLPFKISVGLCLWPGWGMELGWVSLLINYVYTHYHMLVNSEMKLPEESSTMLQVPFKVRGGLFLALGLNLDGLDHLPRSGCSQGSQRNINTTINMAECKLIISLTSFMPQYTFKAMSRSPYFYSAHYCNKNNAYTTIQNFSLQDIFFFKKSLILT